MLIVTLHDAQSRVLFDRISKNSIPIEKIEESLEKIGIETEAGEFIGSRKFTFNGNTDRHVKSELFRTLRALDEKDYVAFQYPDDAGIQIHIFYKELEAQVRKRLAVGIIPVALSEVFPEEVVGEQIERIAA